VLPAPSLRARSRRAKQSCTHSRGYGTRSGQAKRNQSRNTYFIGIYWIPASAGMSAFCVREKLSDSLAVGNPGQSGSLMIHPNQINLRRATPEDRDVAFSVKKTAFREYVEMVWSWNEAEQLALHKRRFTEQEFWIVSIDKLDIGILALTRMIDRIKVNQLFLLPDYQRQGIGSDCIRKILDKSKAKSLPVFIQTLKVNLPAQNFAEKLGFRRVGDTPTHIQWEWSE